MFEITKIDTEIKGLKYRPSLVHHSDDADQLPNAQNICPPQEFSSRDAGVLRDAFMSVRDDCKVIVEIGVHRNGVDSSTHILLENKLDECIYLGIDTENKSFLNDADKNRYTLQTSSEDREKVITHLDMLGGQKIDFLFIDGWHSVNMVVNDWQYTDILSDHGVVVMHDTSSHPGPVVIFDAIDEELYHKEKFFAERLDDWGIAVAKRK
jgi:hypothetical protein